MKIQFKKREELKSRLRSVWDIQYEYWYPLFDCERQDVIAFDSKYIDDEKLEFIKKSLTTRGAKSIYELRENGKIQEIMNIENYVFWNSDPYFRNNECYWFDNNMDWIIYISHEQTTAFGGEWLIQELKESWPGWKSNMIYNFT